MRVLTLCLLAFNLLAQNYTPQPEPQWLVNLRTAHYSTLQTDYPEIEQTWRSALRDPLHPQFPAAAQLASSLYNMYGYELKAERILRQALAAVPGDLAPQTHRNLAWQLASHFETTQQLVKALAIREEMGKPGPAEAEAQSTTDAAALARLYERMGEIEKAEVAWKAASARRTAEMAASGVHPRSATVMRSFSGLRGMPYGFAGSNYGPGNELAGFYARHGRAADAERIYKEAVASEPGSLQAVDAYAEFLAGQQRFDDAIALSRQSLSRLEASPTPDAAQIRIYRQQALAGLLTRAGRTADALAVMRQSVDAAQSLGSAPVYLQSLGSLARALIGQNRLDEAETTVERMRDAISGTNPMAVDILAQIRQRQQRTEEAARLRASLREPAVATGERPPALHDLIAPAEQAAAAGNIDPALALVGQAIALAAERVRTSPQEVTLLLRLAHLMAGRNQAAAARRLAHEALRILEQAPDHPRVADALGSLVSQLAALGLTAEAERALERQERILISAKGEESPALNADGYGRIALLQRTSDWNGILNERKRMHQRTSAATGARSQESLFALREVAWAYAPLDDWPEEERTLLALRTQTVSLLGLSSIEHVNLLEHMANRAAHHRQLDQALRWIDEAIEIAPGLASGSSMLPSLVQTRARFTEAHDFNRGLGAGSPQSPKR
jgi:hypothetical protein